MKLKVSITLIIISLLGFNMYAQLEVNVKRGEFKNKNVGFREAWFHIKEGDKLVKKGKGAYADALKEYLQAVAYNADNAELNYKVGACYLQTDDKRSAVAYLKKAYFSKPEITPEIHLSMARAFHQNLEFDEAIKEYDLYHHFLTNHEKKTIGPLILKYKQECLTAKDIVANPKRVIIKNLGEGVNSQYDDYNSVFGSHDSVMYFVSRRPRSVKEKPNILDYKFDEDIYTATNDSGQWKNSQRFDPKFNNKHHNAVAYASPDGKTLILYNGNKQGGALQISEFKKGKWGKPKKLRGGFNSRGKETSISMTADGKELYFVSDDGPQGFGGKDIYYSFKNDKGNWTKARNVGSTINTMYDEEGVYVKPDGKVLYFSSKGHNTIGGYDIFRTEKSDKNVWSDPQNIGYPVNTPDNELFYRPSVNEKQGYFSAVRKDGQGGMDIYKVIFLGTEKEMMLLTDNKLISFEDKPYIDVFAHKPQEVSIDTVVILRGMITDIKTNQPIVAKINLIDVDHSQVVATTISDSVTGYKIPLPSVKNYGVEINAKNYMFLLDVINMPAQITNREVVKNFALSKVEVGAKVVLKNIYFETAKATLKPESFAELDKVLKFMQENTDIKIEISGHTDNVGTLKANTNLSSARAKAVVDYLSGHGIPVERMTYKGYAFSQPIAPNNTANGRKLNRRVEFKILSKE